MDENLQIPTEVLRKVRWLSDADLTKLLWFISDHSWQKASSELLPLLVKGRSEASGADRRI
jgi:hypothetical protein